MKIGGMAAGRVKPCTQLPVKGADCETCKFKTRPMAVPVTSIGDGRVTVMLGVPGPLISPSTICWPMQTALAPS